MRILSLSADKSIRNPGSAAAGRMVEYGELADGLAIITRAEGGKGVIRLSRKVAVYGAGSAYRPLAFLQYLYLGNKIIREGPVNLITVQDPFETGLAGWILSRRYRLPLQVQVHTDFLSPHYREESFLNRLRVLLAKIIIRRASGVRAVSARIKNSLARERLISEKLIIRLPIYTDAKKIAEAPVKADLRKKYPAFDFIILAASRLAREKNIGLAIRSMEGVLKKHPKAGLIIAGRGKEERELKRLAAPLKGSIIFEPWSDDLASYYKTADLFLITSDYEGWSMAAAEALSAGCPVVMTDVGCAGELVKDGENGFVAPVGGEKEITEKILALAKDENLRKNMALKARQSAESLMGKEEYLSKYRESWEQTIKNSKAV